VVVLLLLSLSSWLMKEEEGRSLGHQTFEEDGRDLRGPKSLEACQWASARNNTPYTIFRSLMRMLERDRLVYTSRDSPGHPHR
jgi:hypothetical protein